ncbi:hypothetical protein [Streptomyces sp. NPDC091217]|uniref:hypothetical protein n=1 Tax=Streptomyces sp. NPDC091217 TaxID=3365975 RepID=UPI00380FF8DA
MIRPAQDATQRRTGPVGERRLYERRKAGTGDSLTAVPSSSASAASTMKRLVSLPSRLVSQRPSSAVAADSPPR